MFWTLDYHSSSPNLLIYFLRASLSLSLSFLLLFLSSLFSLPSLLHNKEYSCTLMDLSVQKGNEGRIYELLSTKHIFLDDQKAGVDSQRLNECETQTKNLEQNERVQSQSCCLSTIWTTTNLLKIYKWVLVTLLMKWEYQTLPWIILFLSLILFYTAFQYRCSSDKTAFYCMFQSAERYYPPMWFQLHLYANSSNMCFDSPDHSSGLCIWIQQTPEIFNHTSDFKF